MTSLEKNIYQTIVTAATAGIKGSEIATKLGIDKRIVNSTLATSVALKAVVEQDSKYKWYTKVAVRSGRDMAALPVPDKDLKAICNYYLSCITLESSSCVSQFLSSRYSKEYAVLNGIAIDATKDADAVQLLKSIAGNKDKKAYLGYPVSIYRVYSQKNGETYQKIAPIFLFAVEYVGGKVEISPCPIVNIEVIKQYSNNGYEALTDELVQLENELGMDEPDTDIETDDLVYRLKEIRQWDWKEEIDPYQIPAAEDISEFADGIYNRPIVISAEQEKYTQGLETELMTLANMPEENYRGTALHSWIKGDFSRARLTDIKPLLEVLPLNTEQAQAVDKALHSDITIVTGPPGTGKSQVVTDLLINIAWNGKSALFSSKNNKAVDVVDIRVNELCRRPVLLRIGNNDYAPRLAEIIEGLLYARPNTTLKADLDYYLQAYNTKIAQIKIYQQQKEDIVTARNKLDEKEQAYCQYRELIGECFGWLDYADIEGLTTTAERYVAAYMQTLKKNNGLFARIFWKKNKVKREANRLQREKEYNFYADKYKLARATSGQTEQETTDLVLAAKTFSNAMRVALEYKNALKKFSTVGSLEIIDKQLAENKRALAEIAANLWERWMLAQSVSFTAEERIEMANFIAAMRLAGNVNAANLKGKFNSLMKKMTKYLQCWAVTSLSAKSKVPFTAGMFDYVIIDEASQCDIASILPLLYRAKRAIIIGDPKQLSHISQLSGKQDLLLLNRFKVQPCWSYSAQSLYELAASKVDSSDIIQLKDHFRSCAEIIEFSNEAFYDGSLRTATKYACLKTPIGEKAGIRWIDIKGETVRPHGGSAFNREEAKAIAEELKRLVNVGYTGTIGVTTPFRRQADEIKAVLEKQYPEVYKELLVHHEFIADTVHKFQGDERDLMLFSTVVTDTAHSTTIGYLKNTGNLFNVAITRARAVLVVVGDYAYCKSCEIGYLADFADYYTRTTSIRTKERVKASNLDGRDYPWVENTEQVSDWERHFYTALYDAGIKTIPQYSADKYKLDLAIITSTGNKLDIEVDGEMYHRRWNGELCYRDQLRNQRLFELGWDVQRFWVYQIRDDLPRCIATVKDWCDKHQL